MPAMRRGWPSVQLRTHKPVQQAQDRYTTSNHTPIQPVRTRQTGTRKPIHAMETQTMPDVDELTGYPLEEDNIYYTSVPAMPRSARRYIDTYGRETRQQGNRRLVIGRAKSARRGLHWLFFIGIGMLAAMLLWQGLMMVAGAWNAHQLDAQYGMPRTWQIDVNVGHGKGKSHFIFENLGGHVFFEELLPGDFTHSHIYTVTTLFGPNAESAPVTADFKDVNGDGKLDIVLHIGTDGASIVYLNDGTGFQPQTQQ